MKKLSSGPTSPFGMPCGESWREKEVLERKRVSEAGRKLRNNVA